jgi:hypothetical protein
MSFFHWRTSANWQAANLSKMKPIACFITAHGYGHAARACSVLEAAAKLQPGFEARIFTHVPPGFFKSSLDIPHTVIPTDNDVGLIQKDTFVHDTQATLDKLHAFLPFSMILLDELADLVQDCSKVYADISPLGIAVAKHTGLPSVLFENFTWDWIYEPFLAEYPGFSLPIRILAETFAQACLHIQSDPICNPVPHTIKLPPASRPPRHPPEEIRDALQIPDDQRFVLLTRAGDIRDLQFLPALKAYKDTRFVFAGGSSKDRREDNLHFLPFDTGFFHPDLVHAADLVIGKAGYGMISEVHASGAPYAYVARKGFRESEVLETYLNDMPSTCQIQQDAYFSGDWLGSLQALLSMPRRERGENGVVKAAELLLA